jgi:LPXTG-motif cell wall-anchored protein
MDCPAAAPIVFSRAARSTRFNEVLLSFARSSRVRIASAFSIAGVLLAGFIVGAAPASAVEYFNTISGSAAYETQQYGYTSVVYSGDILVELVDAGTSEVIDSTHTSASSIGYFWFWGVAPGDYDVIFTSEDPELPSDPVTFDLGQVPQRSFVPEQLLHPRYLDGGAIALAGTPALGETVTATITPFSASGPVDPDVEYQWGYGGVSGGGWIDGANSLSLVVPAEAVGSTLYLQATARADGFAPTRTSATLEGLVSAPKLPATAAPVADSSGLDAFLATHYATRTTPAPPGLPANGLSPEKAYTATIDWAGGDSFVDVFAYSSPRLVGTFAVVNGVVQVSLTPEMLGMIGSGQHTLVLVGQTSGTVAAVGFEIIPTLANTGADVSGSLLGGTALLLLGSGLLLARRRARSGV